MSDDQAEIIYERIPAWKDSRTEEEKRRGEFHDVDVIIRAKTWKVSSLSLDEMISHWIHKEGSSEDISIKYGKQLDFERNELEKDIACVIVACPKAGRQAVINELARFRGDVNKVIDRIKK